MNSIFKSVIYFLLVFSFSTNVANSNDNINASYAKLLILSSTKDISASRLKTDDGLQYQKKSIPYDFKDIYENESFKFSILMAGNYLHIISPFTDIQDVDAKFKIDMKIINLSISPQISYQINNYLSVESEIGIGFSQLHNNSQIIGDPEIIKEAYKENMIGWKSNNVMVYPKFGLVSKMTFRNQDELIIQGHISYAFIRNIERNKGIQLLERTGTWSLGAEYRFNELFNINNKPIHFIASNSIGGFYGNEHRDLGFSFINNTSIALEKSIQFFNKQHRLKLGFGYLYGDSAHGTNLIISTDF